MKILEKKKNIEPFDGVAYHGALNLNSDYAIYSIRKCAEESLRDIPEHVVGKFLYFYLENPVIENPITCKVGKQYCVIHPGQGRVLGSFFKKDPSIQSIFVLLGEDTNAETTRIKEITLDHKKLKKSLYKYGKNVSTEEFQEYYFPSKKSRRYIKAIRSAVKRHIEPLNIMPILWQFENTCPMLLGNGKPKTIIQCTNAIGFYESIIHLVQDKDLQTERFKIVKY